MTSPADELAALPEPIQEALALLVREVIGMSQEEKLTTLHVFNWVADNLLRLAGGAYIDVLQMLNAVGELLAEADRQANPRETVEVG